MHWFGSAQSRWLETNRTLRAVAAMGLLLAGGEVATAANFVGFDPNIHERYVGGVPNPTFVIDESGISGIAGSPSHSINRGHLISPFHVVTSRHTGAPDVRYRTSAGVFNTYSVSTTDFVDLTTNLGGGVTAVSDVRIYRLTDPIPLSDGITPISIVDPDISAIVGQEFFVMGRSNESGLNVVRDVLIAESGGGSVQTYGLSHTYDTDPLHPIYDGVGVGEAQLVNGDSGHAALLQVGDDVGLLGLHLGIDPDGSLYDGVYTNFSSLLAPYLPEIRSIVEGDGYTISTIRVTSVPEPSGLAMLSMFGALAAVRRRR